MSGIGLGSFAQGVMTGLDFRHGKEDRKREIERQKKQDERDAHWDDLREQDLKRKWDREDAAEARSRAAAGRAAAAARRAEAERAAWARAFAGMNQPEGQPVAATEGPTQPRGIAAAVGMPDPPPGPTQIAPPPTGVAPAMPTPDTPPPPPSPAPGVMGAVSADERPREQPTSAVSRDEWYGMSRSERERAQLPVSVVGGEWMFRNRHNSTPQYPTGAEMGGGGPRQGNWPSKHNPSPDMPGGENPEAYGGHRIPTRTLRPEPDSVVTDKNKGDVAPEASAQLASQARGVMQSDQVTPGVTTAAAAVESAVATTSPRGVPGFPTPENVTPRQRDRAGRAAMDRWLENGLPVMQEYYLSRGEIGKLNTLNEWAASQKVRNGMQHWGKAVFAATMGDFEQFGDEIVAAYNEMDYFGDNISIEADKSGFTKDRQGNITGAQLTFKDHGTGKTFKQVFDSVDDLFLTGINMLAPEQAFQYRLQQVEAANQVRSDRDEAVFQAMLKNRFGGGDDNTAERIAEAAAELAKQDFNFASLPLEERVARATEYVRAIDAQAASMRGGAPAGDVPPPPVAYRP